MSGQSDIYMLEIRDEQLSTYIKADQLRYLSVCCVLTSDVKSKHRLSHSPSLSELQTHSRCERGEKVLWKKEWVKRKKRHSSDLHSSQKHIFPPPPPPKHYFSTFDWLCLRQQVSAVQREHHHTRNVHAYSRMLIQFVIKLKEGQGRDTVSVELQAFTVSCQCQLKYCEPSSVLVTVVPKPESFFTLFSHIRP